MTNSTALAIVATALTATIIAVLDFRSRSNIVTAGFWFEDDVTYEIPEPERIGGPLTPEERALVRRVAREEVAHAFKDLGLRIVDGRDAFYRVGVRQVLTLQVNPRRRPWSGAAGQSNVFGPLGGYGGVSFFMLASQALRFAPPEATRAEIIAAIGRGIGRSAVHEFAHQILPHEPLHGSRDEFSYEYATSNRRAQYYGEMRWSVAHGALRERLARR
jgi:hypothetical protein